jgi:DNA-3-methyladenine glycosylase
VSCSAWSNQTQCAAVWSAGHAYVYLNYGIHNLVNAVTEAEGSPAAVLIRGARAARWHRVDEATPARAGGRTDEWALPRAGNLTQALGITLKQNRSDLSAGPLWIEDRGLPSGTLSWSPRIGIRVGVDRPWRCSLASHPSVSGTKQLMQNADSECKTRDARMKVHRR